jgi:hypothetical protein
MGCGLGGPPVQRTLLNGAEESTRRHLAAFSRCSRSRKPVKLLIRITFPSILICQTAIHSIRSDATVRSNGCGPERRAKTRGRTPTSGARRPQSEATRTAQGTVLPIAGAHRWLP